MSQALDNKKSDEQTNDHCRLITRKRKRDVFDTAVEVVTSADETILKSSHFRIEHQISSTLNLEYEKSNSRNKNPANQCNQDMKSSTLLQSKVFLTGKDESMKEEKKEEEIIIDLEEELDGKDDMTGIKTKNIAVDKKKAKEEFAKNQKIWKSISKLKEGMDTGLAEKERIISELNKELAEKDWKISRKDRKLAEKENTLLKVKEEMVKQLTEREGKISQLETKVAQLDG